MNENMVDNLLDQADSLIDIDRSDEALSLLQEAAKLVPENPDVLCRFSRAYLSLEDWNSAMSYGNMAVAAAPEEEWGHRLCSIALRRLGNPHEGLRAATAALNLDPENVQCIRNLANSQMECEQYGTAENTAWRAVQLEPDDADGYVTLARLYYRQNMWRQAEEQARKALEIEPENSSALSYLADSVSNYKGKRLAIPYYVRVLQNNPANTAAQKLVLEQFSRLPYVVVPALLVVLCAVLTYSGMNGLAAFCSAVLLSVASGMMLFRFWPDSMLYPQPTFWKLPASHRDFVKRTWQREWLKRSGSVIVLTGLLLGLIALPFVALIAILVFPPLGAFLFFASLFSKDDKQAIRQARQRRLEETFRRFRP